MSKLAVPHHMYRICSLFAALSAVTTIGIHTDLFPSPRDFNDALQLYTTAPYILGKWWVICHCLFVIISIYGICHYLAARERRFAWLGFTFYAAFGFFEILRMFLVLTYLSGMRDQYLTADTATQSILRVSMDNFNGIGSALFASFTVAILLGNLFTGISAFAVAEVKWLGVGLLAWVVVLTLALINDFWPMEGVSSFLGYFSLIFQPAIRFYLAVCLFRVTTNQI